MKKELLASALLLFLGPPLTAHDFWIQPQRFEIAPGNPIGLDLRVGDEAPGRSLAFDPQHAERFALVGPDGEQPVLGLAGRRPAGNGRIESPGLHAAVYRSRETPLELAADRFEAYLAEEGLDSVVAERQRRGETESAGRELFSRCAKALIRSARPGEAITPEAVEAALAPLGLELELVAERDPTRASTSELPLRALLRGEPLVGVRIEATALSGDGRVTAQRTDSEGRVHLPIDGRGQWLVTAVHMEPAPADSGHDWRSLWASLTFER
ncbi:MAG: DUF4198 domain-containing protein [Acidobacteriota bacterium]